MCIHIYANVDYLIYGVYIFYKSYLFTTYYRNVEQYGLTCRLVDPI